MTSRHSESLLCVVNYPANTGFAWNFIEGLYVGVANDLHHDGIKTFVAYPAIKDFPAPIRGSAAEPLLLDASLNSLRSIRATIAEVRRLNIRTVYYTDRGFWHAAYPLLRAAGVRRIVAHDHTSGARTEPHGLKRAAKWIKARVPGMSPDLIITVSEFVSRRQRNVALVPPERVVRLWNGIDLPELAGPASPPPIPEMAAERPVVLCVCRAAPEKGVDYLMRAFDKVAAAWPPDEPRPLLVYVGNGPQLDELNALRLSLAARDDMILTGYRNDVPRFIEHATIAVVPSVWQDACPLGVLEPMAYAKPVIASSVGGVPDEIDSPEVGELVPPADVDALALAISRMLRDPQRRAAIGSAARMRIARNFFRPTQISALVALVRGRASGDSATRGTAIRESQAIAPR